MFVSLSSPITAAQQALGSRVDNAWQRLFHPDALVRAGQTPFETIHEDGPFALRYYPPLTEQSIPLADGTTCEVATTTQRTPLVLVPPLAVNMLVYDLFPERSLVRYLRARGFEVYMVDWGKPAPADDKRDLAGYFADLLPGMLERVRSHSGQRRLSLHGWSFGGLFSLCHAALTRDADIANLVLVGAPVDYHKNGVLGARYRELSRRATWLRRKTGLTAHSIPSRLLRSPGRMNSLVFKLTSPMASVKSYADLFRNLHDDDYVSNHTTNAAFLDQMEAYPGGVVQDFVDYLWVDNVLGQGQLPMANPTGELADIRAPILNISGRNDPIVTPDCSQAMTGFVSSTDVTCETIKGGHVGIVSSAIAQKQTWGRIADWLIARD